MMHNGVCLGGPYHGQILTSDLDVLRVLDIEEVAVLGEPALTTTERRTGIYTLRRFRTTSGDVVGVWDWEGWSS